MSKNTSVNAMDNLLREGAASYLDAISAIQRFKKRVTDIASGALTARLPELIEAVGIPGPQPSYVTGIETSDSDTWAWVASRIWFPEPWNGNCLLGLRFERSEAREHAVPYVIFACNGGTAEMRRRMGNVIAHYDRERYWDNDPHEVGLRWELRDPLHLDTEIESMMNNAISVWKKIGGWAKLQSIA